jgi:hypothetical protein
VKIIIPYVVSAMSTAANTNTGPESFSPDWSNATAYTKGALVVSYPGYTSTKLVYNYVAVQDVPAGTGLAPGTAGAEVYWAIYRTSNRWAMYDPSPSTRTYSADPGTDPLLGSATARTLTVSRTQIYPFVIDPATGLQNNPGYMYNNGAMPRADSLVMMNTLCTTVDMTFGFGIPGGGTVGNVFATITPAGVARSARDFIIGVPTSYSGNSAYETFSVTAAVKSTAASAMFPGVGFMALGYSYTIGDSLPGLEVGIVDYSSVNTDTYGNTSLVQRGYAKTMRLRVRIPTSSVDAVHKKLASLRAVPVVWVGEDAFESTLIYGIFKDFSVDIAYPGVSFCSITVSGIA